MPNTSWLWICAKTWPLNETTIRIDTTSTKPEQYWDAMVQAWFVPNLDDYHVVDSKQDYTTILTISVWSLVFTVLFHWFSKPLALTIHVLGADPSRETWVFNVSQCHPRPAVWVGLCRCNSWSLALCQIVRCETCKRFCDSLGSKEERNYSIETRCCCKPMSTCNYMLVRRSGQPSFWRSDSLRFPLGCMVCFCLLLWLFPAWPPSTPAKNMRYMHWCHEPLRTKEDAVLVMVSIGKSSLCLRWYEKMLSPAMIFGFHAEKKMCIASPTAAKAFRFFRRNAYIQMHQTTQSCVHSNDLGSLADSWSCWLLWCVACSFDDKMSVLFCGGGAIIEIIPDWMEETPDLC